MAINAVLPTASSAIQPKSAGFPAEQSKLSEGLGEKTQIQNSVSPTDEAEGNFDNGNSAGNKEGRGQLVDLKI